MKIKLDENMPASLCAILNGMGHDADTVPLEGFPGCDDDKVWALAQEARRFLLAQDMDFSDLRKFAFSKHHGIMVIRLHEPGREALINKTKALFETEDVEAMYGCFVVVTDHKIRIRQVK